MTDSHSYQISWISPGAGWTVAADYSGNSYTTDFTVTLTPLSQASLQFNVTPPSTAASGIYDVIVNIQSLSNAALVDSVRLQVAVAGADGLIDNYGYSQLGAIGTGNGGSSSRTVASSVTTAYAVSITNRTGGPESYTLTWNTPVGWTVVLNNGTAGASCNGNTTPGTDFSSPCVTGAVPANSGALYTLLVTPPSGSIATQTIILDIVSTVLPAYSNDSIKAVALVPTDTDDVAASTALTVWAPAGTEGERQLNLGWTDGSTNEVGFEIERVSVVGPAACNGQPNYTRVATVLRDSLQSTMTGEVIYYANTGLTPGIDYCYRVRAFDADKRYSDYTYPTPDSSVATNATGGAPGDVTDLTIVPNRKLSYAVSLTWTAPTPSGTSYDLRYSLSAITPGNFGTACTNTTAATLNATRPTDCAVLVIGLDAPLPAGTAETQSVLGRINSSGQCDVTLSNTTAADPRPLCLVPNTSYYFALKTMNGATPSANVSNVAGGDDPTDGSDSGRTAVRAGYNLVSVPMNPISPNPIVVFSDDVKPVELYRWDSTGPGPADGSFVSYATAFTNFVQNADARGVWRLDEAAGTTAADVSGYGNTLNIGSGNTAPVWDTIVKQFGASALSFDGNNDFAEVLDGGTASINLGGAAQLTLEAWVRTNDLTVVQNLLDKRNAASTADTYVLQLVTDAACVNSLKVRAFSFNGTQYPFGADTTGCVIASTTTGYHVAVVYSNALTNAGRLRIFVNGIERATTVPNFIATGGGIGGSNLVGVTESLFVGQRAYPTVANNLDGYLDEIVVWNRALSSEEVAAHAAAALSPTTLQVRTGEGFFLRAGDAAGVIDVPVGSAETDTLIGTNCGVANSYSVAVELGWNLAGNPFRRPVSLGAASVCRAGVTQVFDDTDANATNDAVSLGWVGMAMYGFNGSSYQPLTIEDTLPARFEPWQAYWVEVLDPSVTHLVFPQPPP
jgi:hypothetical protein